MPELDLADRLYISMRHRKKTPGDLARHIIGRDGRPVHRNTISNYCNGRTRPDGPTIEKLASLLEVNPVWLMTGHAPGDGPDGGGTLIPFPNTEPTCAPRDSNPEPAGSITPLPFRRPLREAA